MLAICSEEERKTGVFGWRRKKAKEAKADGEVTVPMGLFIAQDEEAELVAVRRYGFFPLDLIEERMGKKTEGESADSCCVDGEVKGEGQRRDFCSPPTREARWQ